MEEFLLLISAVTTHMWENFVLYTAV